VLTQAFASVSTRFLCGGASPAHEMYDEENNAADEQNMD
jgi:hypothetical protein